MMSNLYNNMLERAQEGWNEWMKKSKQLQQEIVNIEIEKHKLSIEKDKLNKENAELKDEVERLNKVVDIVAKRFLPEQRQEIIKQAESEVRDG